MQSLFLFMDCDDIYHDVFEEFDFIARKNVLGIS